MTERTAFKYESLTGYFVKNLEFGLKAHFFSVIYS
jgi:hypothetical protein